jgi:ubiquinone/menaquinone biosynthesis C-methylase UbiE
MVGVELSETASRSCDLVVSTLALGYVRDASTAIAEWCRVLRPGGDLKPSLVYGLHFKLAGS